MASFFKLLYISLLWSTLVSLTTCNKGYEKSGNIITYNDEVIAVRDPKTFEVKKYDYATDSKVAYFHGREIPESHGPSFSIINKHFSRDKEHVYWCASYLDGTQYYTRRSIDTYVLEGVDPLTFQLMDYGYFKDKNHVYLNRQEIIDADPATFKIAASEYAYDKNQIYWRGYGIWYSHGPSFQYIEYGYAKDKEHIYYEGDDIHAEVSSFLYLGVEYARDKNHIYFKGKSINVDGPSFQYLNRGYAIDKAHVYFQGKDIDADVESFHVDSTNYTFDAKDKNHSYQFGKKL